MVEKVGWTSEEDSVIERAYKAMGPHWTDIAEMLHDESGERRSGDSVRNRWLRLQKRAKLARSEDSDSSPVAASADLSAGGSGERGGDMWSWRETQTIEEGVRKGLKWKAIAALLPGRSDSSCRNRWLRKKQKELAMAGINVRNAAEVVAACRRVGLLGPYNPQGAEANGPNTYNCVQRTSRPSQISPLSLYKGPTAILTLPSAPTAMPIVLPEALSLPVQGMRPNELQVLHPHQLGQQQTVLFSPQLTPVAAPSPTIPVLSPRVWAVPPSGLSPTACLPA